MISESLESIVRSLRLGEIDVDRYLTALEARIEERDPVLRALEDEPGRFGRLQREAQALLEEYPDPQARPVLFGAPVGVKDIFNVDGLPTRAGSRLPARVFEGPESTAVSQLRAAGALILGKTVSTEFAYFAPGPTRNPRDPERTPGGSSSGSAAAVGAGECPLALGTQTIGSISRPASFCGVVGYKPSYDRISRDGVVPLSPSLDHVGTFTSTVAGAELAAAALCHEWRPWRREERPVLGIWTGRYLESAEPEGIALFEEVCRHLEGSGYRIEQVEVQADLEAVSERHALLVAAEAAAVHEQWVQEFGERYHPRTLELIERGRGVPEVDIERARASRSELRRELMVLMAEHGLDLWISPAARGVAPRGLDSTGDPAMNLPWTHAGLPTVAIPAAVDDDGLPLGLQIAGAWWEDERLLAWAEEIESALARPI